MAFMGIFVMFGAFVFLYLFMLFFAFLSLIVGIILGKKTRFKKTGFVLRLLGYLVLIPNIMFFIYALLVS